MADKPSAKYSGGRALIHPFELWVGLRYTRAKRQNHFISFISAISTLGIALGVTALITVLSVMNGFDRELKGRILGIVSHVTVEGLGRPLQQWRSVAAAAKGMDGVVGVAPYVQAQGLLANRELVSGAMVRGILPEEEEQVAAFAKNLIHGKPEGLRAGDFGIVLGESLARSLGVGMGDRVTLISPEGQVTPLGFTPRFRRFTVVGVFSAGMYEYDSGLAYIHMGDAQKMFRLGEGVTGVRLRLADQFQAPRLALELRTRLQGQMWVQDWTEMHANFFRALKIEKTVMFIILLLIIAVAAFNIVSTLVMAVTDKQADIAILRTLGASPGQITLIFMVQGMLIGMFGTAVGVTGGVLLAANVPEIVPALESLLHTHFLSPDIYFISELPSEIRWSDVWKIAVASLVMSWLAAVYPAWRAARIDPAEALRYE